MRPGLVENSQQFDFCHLVLEQALWGRVAKEMAQAAPVEKTKKWWQFKRKEKNKPPKAKKEKKAKKSKSKHGQSVSNHLVLYSYQVERTLLGLELVLGISD